MKRKMKGKNKKKDEGWVDVTDYFKEVASKDNNPFDLVTHVGGKKRR